MEATLNADIIIFITLLYCLYFQSFDFCTTCSSQVNCAVISLVLLDVAFWMVSNIFKKRINQIGVQYSFTNMQKYFETVDIVNYMPVEVMSEILQ